MSDNCSEDLYPQRYCAFIDILGFREIVSRLDSNQMQVFDLIDLLKQIHHPKSTKTLRESIGLKVQSISDAVAISAPPTPSGLAQLFLATDTLTINLLRLGYFIRGAITKGRLFHDQNMIFGEGLVKAYQFESTIARFARLIVTRDVKLDIDKYASDAQYSDLYADRIKQAHDGPFFSNSLRDIALAATLADPAIKFAATALGSEISAMRDNVQRRLDEAVDYPSRFEKIQWFASYWNETMPHHEDMPPIKGPGMSALLALE